VSDPSGITAYDWEVSRSSTFATVIRNGSTSTATQATVSGLANGTYFWHVQAVDGNLAESAWSSAQSFTVKGATSATPATPALNPPKGGTNQFHPFETITWTWSAVPGATSYVFEASQDPAFPVATEIRSTVSTTGTTLELADDSIGNWQARVSAVDANGIRSVPSKTQSFSISYNAPLPAPPTPLAPTGGASVSLPVTVSWKERTRQNS
jgi:predicted phage tail protein